MDPDQIASLVFLKKNKSGLSRTRVKPGFSIQKPTKDKLHCTWPGQNNS